MAGIVVHCFRNVVPTLIKFHSLLKEKYVPRPQYLAEHETEMEYVYYGKR